MKYVDAVGYGCGAFVWPYTAGLMINSDSWFPSVVLLCFSFAAWWKIAKWLKLVETERKP